MRTDCNRRIDAVFCWRTKRKTVESDDDDFSGVHLKPWQNKRPATTVRPKDKNLEKIIFIFLYPIPVAISLPYFKSKMKPNND